MKLTALFDPITEELELVEHELQTSFQAEQDNAEIREAASHILNAGGKRLRPALLLLVSHLGNHDRKRAIRAGVVVEQIHLATLIHDDVVDQAELRRGETSINSRWNNKFAVLLGDYLYSSAFFDILSDPDLRIVEAVVSATKDMTKGELLQAIVNGNPKITEAEYFKIIEAKTAKLISACCRIGACITEFTPEQVQLMTRFGYHLGIAFQITDDLLDIISSSEKIGKPAGNDAREGNYTLPLIISLTRAGIHDHNALLEFLSNPIDDHIWANIAEYINRYEGVEYALLIAKDHIARAHDCLNQIPKGPTSHILHDITDFIIARDF